MRGLMSFENFWKLYPNKKEKLYARKCYDQAIRGGATHEEILIGVQNYIKWLNQADGTTWRPSPKMPATFLNKGCWLDEYEQQEAYVSPEESRQKARISGFFKYGLWKDDWGPKPEQQSNVVDLFSRVAS